MPLVNALPLSLYIHLPWCVRKCPYCDFNSHELKNTLPEELYVSALRSELLQHLPLIQDRQIISIFFGGGTPSLFSPAAIKQILSLVTELVTLAPNCEITLEANPGTMDQARFHGFREAGINRLSIGIQSLQNDKLKTLGRIHDREHALQAVAHAKAAGFTNFNLDIMYGLPQQSIEDALHDINAGLDCAPTHFSWYQLTIEPNTLFHYQQPILPHDDTIWEMQVAGQARIAAAGFKQYEVSAYARDNLICQHNLNYWEFGDYLGLGAGAHSKITDSTNKKIWRFSQVKNPRDYLDTAKRNAVTMQSVEEKDLIFEFMLNALRLTDGVSKQLFVDRTGVALEKIKPLLDEAKRKGLLIEDKLRICPSKQGKKFLNDVMEMFLVT